MLLTVNGLKSLQNHVYDHVSNTKESLSKFPKIHSVPKKNSEAESEFEVENVL